MPLPRIPRERESQFSKNISDILNYKLILKTNFLKELIPMAMKNMTIVVRKAQLIAFTTLLR